jgi:hypothetical protein
MKVVLGGSRKLGFIPDLVSDELLIMMKDSSSFLIGDAPGIDSIFQKFMTEGDYRNVEIFSSAGYVRNNLGKWPEQQIETTLKSKSNALHAFKDREMCKRADLGIMVWDQESAGTLSNALDLLDQEKTCFIYDAVEQEFIRFETRTNLDKWLEKHSEVAAEAHVRLNRFRNRMKIGSKMDSLQSELF